MSDHRQDEYFILINSKLGKKKERSILRASSKSEVLPGSLLILLEERNETFNSVSRIVWVLETLDPDNIEIECSPEDVQQLDVQILALLQPIPVCNERLTVFLNKDWLNEGLTIVEGDGVFVSIKGHPDLQGTVRYKGELPGQKGIQFGVELSLENYGKGTCDGVFRKKRYFTCPSNSGVFVPLHKLRKDNSVRRQKRFDASNSINQQRIIQDSHASNWNFSPPPAQRTDLAPRTDLKEGDRVMWLSDQTGPEFGIVKWIGILPDSAKRDVTVGVEFDNPVGSGTGKYKSHRLFHAKPQHASLVPIMGLMKAEEFLSTQTSGNVVSTDEYTSSVAGQMPSTEIVKEQEKLLEQARQRKVTTKSEIFERGSMPQVDKEKSMMDKKAISYPIKKSNVVPMDMSEGQHYPEKSKLDDEKINPLYDYNRINREIRDVQPCMEPQSAHRYEEPKKDSYEQPTSRKTRSIPDADPDLEVGSMVEVMSNPPLYGVIRWIGYLPDQKEPLKHIAGLEMEEEISAGTDGTFGNHRMFSCPQRKGFFVPLYKCRKDKRFMEMGYRSGNNFGSMETPDVGGNISPPDSLDLSEINHKVCGKQRGIQGHHNSCYLDATLFSMFYFVTVFDGILYRPRGQDDISEYDEVKQVIKEGIVNPLRKYHYVRADKVMKLRHLLDKLGNIPGMMNEEKDPEEFLNLLLHHITKAEPLLHIRANEGREIQNAYFYQLIMEKDERLVLPTTQQLFELSFLEMKIKLQERPSCLIIQMPRFGKNYKMYKRIVPSMELDITDVLEYAPRECIICGDLAMFECRQCYQVHGAGLNTIAFCESCKDTSHQHKTRVYHNPQRINVPPEYVSYHTQQKQITGQIPSVPRDKMELFAVVCIQTSHYVAFVKCGRGRNAPWVFFDSMADRMGEQSGYNIPEVQLCEELNTWLSEDYHEQIIRRPDDKDLPEHMRRLLCDAYMCMYYNPEVSMFK